MLHRLFELAKTNFELEDRLTKVHIDEQREKNKEK